MGAASMNCAGPLGICIICGRRAGGRKGRGFSLILPLEPPPHPNCRTSHYSHMMGKGQQAQTTKLTSAWLLGNPSFHPSFRPPILPPLLLGLPTCEGCIPPIGFLSRAQVTLPTSLPSTLAQSGPRTINHGAAKKKGPIV